VAGVTDFEGRHCYWLHGTTHWVKDNHQFYAAQTRLLAGCRFQADDSSPDLTIATFEDYGNFGRPLVAAKSICHPERMCRLAKRIGAHPPKDLSLLTAVMMRRG
jgi:hypothetical protein